LLASSSDGCLLLDSDGVVVDANPAAGAAHGRRRGELAGRPVGELLEGLALLDDGASPQPATGRRADGSSFPAEVSVESVDAGAGRLLAVLVRDLDQRERIDYLSGHDALTGLLNKQSFGEHLEEAVERAERARRAVAVLHVDLNGFALINQGLGFDGGDELLREVASRLREAMRPMDLSARLSADEFLLLAADLGPEGSAAGGGAGEVAGAQALEVADAVHRALERPFEIGGREVYTGAAVGVSLYPFDAEAPAVLLRHACSAAGQAKRPGEAPTVLYAGDTTDKWARLSLAARLHRAVDEGDLLLHYQPIVELQERRTVAAEALARWPDRGDLLPAARFIPLAEDLGLIDAIGEWVVGEACRQAAEWRSRGEALDVAFNLSLQELWRADLPERIAAQTSSAGLEPGALIVEVTESSAMTDPVRTQEVLGRLRAEGFTLALDDFGTGHSSLGRLAELPCQLLKIDRSFTARLPGDPSAAAMVTAIVDLARRLGMRAVAEGIETDEQLRFLAELGCPLGQGYLLGRPVAADQLVLS